MITRMPPWRGRAATLADGRRVGAMRMDAPFAFHVPDVYDPATGACVAHGGNVAGPRGTHVVCDAGAFFAVPAPGVTYDDEARAALADNPAALAVLDAHLASHPVDADDLVATEA